MQKPTGSPNESGAQVQIVGREDIPLATEHGENAHRPFQAHEILSQFLPDPDRVAFDWLDLEAGQTLTASTDAGSRLLVVIAGSAQLTGPLARAVTQDNLVAIPAHCEYGITDVGAKGFHAISIQFDAQASTDKAAPSAGTPDEISTLEELLAYNDKRLAETIQNEFFTSLRNGRLDDPARRQTYVDCIQVFSDVFQKIILGRQATCRDSDFEPVFLAHMAEELGHNELLAARPKVTPIRDPILRATLDWFAHQMLVRDNAEKAALVHLILETAGHIFHSRALEVFASEVSASYYQVHAEDDEQHAEMGLAPLRDLHPSKYQRLRAVLEDGWNMLNAVQNRIVEIVTTTHPDAKEAIAK